MQTLKQIQQQLRAHANTDAAAAHHKFVPGAEKIYGVRTPVLNDLAKAYKSQGFDLVDALWESGWLEEKILAGKLLERIAKTNPQRALKTVDRFSKDITDWAVCDCIGMQSLKGIVKTHDQEIFALARKYNTSKNLWQRRLSLVLVEWYTRFPERHADILALVATLENDPEYYVKKAVVWIKKNFNKGK